MQRLPLAILPVQGGMATHGSSAAFRLASRLVGGHSNVGCRIGPLLSRSYMQPQTLLSPVWASSPLSAPAGRSFSSSVNGSIQDPYKVLGVSRNASADEIKKAYRKQAMKWHPDKNPPEKREEAQKQFNAVANAYEILSDPVKKQQYDTSGGMGNFHSGGGGFPGGGPQFYHTQESAEKLFHEIFGNQQMSGFGDIFSQLLGQTTPGARLRVGTEVRVSTDVHTIHNASRRSNIDSTYDAIRQRAAGRRGKVLKVDPEDDTVKVDVMGVGPVWFGRTALSTLGAATISLKGFPGGGFEMSGFGSGQRQRQEIFMGKDGRRKLRIITESPGPDGKMRRQTEERDLDKP